MVSIYQHIVYDDVARMECDKYVSHFESSSNERLHAEAKEFYNLLNAASQPIWPTWETHFELSLAVQMLSIKSYYNVTHRSLMHLWIY